MSQMNTTARKWLILTGMALGSSTGCQPNTPDVRPSQTGVRDKVFDATEDDLQIAQAKITYHGAQFKPIRTVLFFTRESQFSMDSFTAVQLGAGDGYGGNDHLAAMRFVVTAREFRSMLRAVRSILTANENQKIAVDLTLTIVVKEGDKTFGHECLVPDNSKVMFYRKLVDALDESNDVGRETLFTQCLNSAGTSIRPARK
jgi:hypothetical protein